MDRFVFLECSFKQLAEGKYTVGTLGKLASDLDRDAELNPKFFYSIKGGKWVKYLDLKFNICDGLHALLSLPLANTIKNDVLEVSNIPNKCPIKGNFMYNISNVLITNKYFPSYTPREMDFNGSLTYLEHQKEFAILWFEGRTIPL
ncbi:uncharacterized protein LOC131996224 [Stomoxys calcitrans]|uniref:uncharacterized protein LOC131996224 n=1 Tax=Stomoxys calcitrans TaxID=35570 RepID=UPI0027E31A01|nr:uncharacterized protein LOC131996224 [Stomoxys calcitrans]